MMEENEMPVTPALMKWITVREEERLMSSFLCCFTTKFSGLLSVQFNLNPDKMQAEFDYNSAWKKVVPALLGIEAAGNRS